MTNALITRDTIGTTTSKQLLAFFNAHTGGNQLVKFQNRLQGEARVLALINEMEAEEAGDQKAASAACQRGDALMMAAEAVKKLAAVSKKESIRLVGKPYQNAKAVVADCIGKGITARKDIIAAGLAAGIKYNTIDGAHYTMCVKKD